MSDVRTLLDAAAGAGTTTADPVGAVHTRVRRRAARRRTAVAAGTTAVVAGATVLAGNGGARDRVTAGPAAGATATPTRTADVPVPATVHDPAYAPYAEEMARLAKAHPGVFLRITEEGSDNALGWQLTVAVAAGVDTSEWDGRMSEAAGPAPWGWKRCTASAARYDQVAAELTAFAWPSGATVAHGPILRAVTYADRCQVEVTLSTPNGATTEDVAAAKARWGGDAIVHGLKPTPSAAAPGTG